MEKYLRPIFILLLATLACMANAAGNGGNFSLFDASGSTVSSTNGLKPVATLRITGVAREPSGMPAAGVLVAFHPGYYPGASDYTEARSDANGRYEVVLHPKTPGFFWGHGNSINTIVARDFEGNLSAISEFTEIPTNLD